MSMSPSKQPWPNLPESIKAQAAARWGSGKRAAGPGDRFLYHWVREEPAPDYCGPLPAGRLLRRTREA
jgi:hypothetical protein